MIYDYQNCIDYAREKGEAKGRDEGLAEGLSKGEAKGLAKGEKIAKIETAKNLLNMGLSITRICLSDWSYRKRYRKSSSSLTP